MTTTYTEAQMEAHRENQRRFREQADLRRRVYELTGMPLICAEPGCRRAGRCLGEMFGDRYRTPPCGEHYREEFRYLFFGPIGLLSLVRGTARVPKAEPGSGLAAWLARFLIHWPLDAQGVPVPFDSPRQGPRGSGRRLWETIYGAEDPGLVRLKRPKGTQGPAGWEHDPDAFARYMAEGDWSKPLG